MADRFRALHERDTVSFQCWFNRVRNPGRSWIVEDLGFPHAFIPAVPFTRGRLGCPSRHYRQANPHIVVTFHADIGVAPAILHGFRRDGSLVYYVEKTFDEWVPRTSTKEALKKRLFAHADAFLSPGTDADAYICTYRAGAPIHRLAPVIQTERFADAARQREAGTTARRTSLGLQGFVFMNVGRMWWQKGISTLLDAYVSVRARGILASLLLIGDGVDRDHYVRHVKAASIPNVQFVDFVQQAELPSWYALGDAFVFPTRGDPYGIVIAEAMASGLPIISSDHAGELAARVIPSDNGAIVPIDDPVALAEAMSALARDPKGAHAMGKRAGERIQNRTLDVWVDSVEQFVASVRGHR